LQSKFTAEKQRAEMYAGFDVHAGALERPFTSSHVVLVIGGVGMAFSAAPALLSKETRPSMPCRSAGVSTCS